MTRELSQQKGSCFEKETGKEHIRWKNLQRWKDVKVMTKSERTSKARESILRWNQTDLYERTGSVKQREDWNRSRSLTTSMCVYLQRWSKTYQSMVSCPPHLDITLSFQEIKDKLSRCNTRTCCHRTSPCVYDSTSCEHSISLRYWNARTWFRRKNASLIESFTREHKFRAQ